MAENIVYHSVIIVFIFSLCLYSLHLKNTLKNYQNPFIPFLLQSNLSFPQNQSLIVRTVFALEKELTHKLHTKVSIKYNKDPHTFSSDRFKIFFELMIKNDVQIELINELQKIRPKKIIFLQKNSHTPTLDTEKKVVHSDWEITFV